MGAIISPYQIGTPLTLTGTPTIELRAQNYNGTTWTNLGSLGTTGDYTTGGTAPPAGAADSNFNNKHAVRFTSASSHSLVSVATLSQAVTNSDATILAVLRLASTSGDSGGLTSANGRVLFTDSGGFMTFGESDTFRYENFDGSDDVASDSRAQDVTYGIQLQHTGGNITFLRSGSTIQTTASGNTTDLTNTMQIGRQGSSTKYADFSLALLVYWNTALSSGDLTTNRNNTAAFYNFTW